MMSLIIAAAVTVLFMGLIGMLNYQAWKPSPPYMKDAVGEWLFRIIAGSASVLLFTFLMVAVWPRVF